MKGWKGAHIGCGGVGGGRAFSSPRCHAVSPRTPETLAARAGRSKAVDCGDRRKEGASRSSRRVEGLTRSFAAAAWQAVESKETAAGFGKETAVVRSGGWWAGGSVGSWRRRARKASEYAIAGLCGPTRQSFKAANRTCSELATCKLGERSQGEICGNYFLQVLF